MIMVLFDLKFYLNNVLVVGDGNFLFIVCLVFVLLEMFVKIVVIFLDLCVVLVNNDFVVENIDKLFVFKNVEILYEVDVINLIEKFG